MNLYQRTLIEMKELLKGGEVSAEELTQAHLDWIAATDDRLNSFNSVVAEKALNQARGIDQARANGGNRGSLAGIPGGLKDNIVTRGIPTTCSSRILEGYLSPYDATVAQKLQEAGTVIIGKTNLDEFAMGSSTENSAFGMTNNPWDLDRVPGGSSGGSAAAVAARQLPFALGSDTGGSVRQPAALCGVVGMKPTYGLVSRYGLVAFASSLDQIGPLTRTVEDCALLMETICGHDPLDSTSLEGAVPSFTQQLDGDIKGLRVGVPKEYFGEGISRGVRDLVLDAIEVLAGLGAEIEECSLPHTEYALPAYYIIAPAEASSNLARFDGIRYGFRAAGFEDLEELYTSTRQQGFGPEVKRRILIGTYALSSGYYDAYYRKAQQVRTLITDDFREAFQHFDVLVSPTSPTVAFRSGERKDDPLAMYMADICTIPANLAGLPAISVPCGFSEGLPVGLQVIGKPLDDGRVMRVAHAYQESTGHHSRIPDLLAPDERDKRDEGHDGASRDDDGRDDESHDNGHDDAGGEVDGR